MSREENKHHRDGTRALQGYVEYKNSITATLKPRDLDKFKKLMEDEIAMKFKHGTCKICMGPNTFCSCMAGISDFASSDEEGT